jgi:hypothetical protein
LASSLASIREQVGKFWYRKERKTWMKKFISFMVSSTMIVYLFTFAFVGSVSAHERSSSTITHSSAINATTVPCSSSNKVGLQKTDGNWVCYGGSSGDVYPNFTVQQINPDSWSGWYYWADNNSSRNVFCDHYMLSLQPPVKIVHLYLSPTHLSQCP